MMFVKDSSSAHDGKHDRQRLVVDQGQGIAS